MVRPRSCIVPDCNNTVSGYRLCGGHFAALPGIERRNLVSTARHAPKRLQQPAFDRAVALIQRLESADDA